MERPPVFAPEVSDSLDVGVALYGLEPHPDRARAFYDHSLRLFERLHLTPNKMVVDRDQRATRLISFRAGEKNLRERGFGGVHSFSLLFYRKQAMPTFGHPALDCSWSGSYATVSAESLVTNLGDPALRDWLCGVAHALCPEYGIGYYLPRHLDAGMYAMGRWVRREDSPPEWEAEFHRQAQWRYDAMVTEVWCEGVLRDVYPWNLLNHAQLSQVIDGAPLRDWIARGSSRGSLTKILEGSWLWEVPAEGAEPLRQALANAGLLYQAPPRHRETDKGASD